MDLSDDEVRQRAEADRREVDPPIQVVSESRSLGWGELFVKSDPSQPSRSIPDKAQRKGLNLP